MRFNNEYWSSQVFSDIFDISNGLNKDKSCFGHGFPIINYMDVNKNAFIEFESINGKVDVTDKEITNYLVTPNDILITRTSEVKEEIAYSACLLDDGKCVFSGFLLRAHPKNNNTYAPFIVYMLRSQEYRKQLEKYATETSRALINSENLGKIIINLPTIQTQKKIADFLMLLDTRINTQIKIIEDYEVYKKNIEMKILLKGHKCISKLADLCSITTGKKDANAATSDGKYKFFTCGREDLLINTYSFDGDAILISGNGEVGLTKFYSGKFDAYQRTYVLQNFKIDPIYLKMIIDQKLKTKIMREKNVGAMPYIVLSTLENFEIPLIDEKETLLISRLIKMLDDKIKKEKDMLDAYKKQKAYLLKEMFI